MQRSWEKIWLIVRREYWARVRQRSFVIITILMAVIFVVIACAPTIIQAIRHGRENTTTIVIVDTTGTGAAKDLVTQVTQGDTKALANAGTGIPKFVEIDAPPGTIKTDASNGSMTINAPPNTVVIRASNTSIGVSSTAEGRRYQIDNGNVAGFLLVERDQSGALTYTYQSKSGTSDANSQLLYAAASTASIRDRLTRTGIGPAQQTQIFAPPIFSISPTDTGASANSQSDTQQITNRGIAYILDILLYTTIIVYGMWIAGGVVEEKSNRIMEIMINAATPTQLMAGKILGIGAAALTQYLCITIPGAVALASQGRIAQALLGTRSGAAALDLTGITAAAVVAFLGFFILGFLLYAALYAGAGSLVSRQEDVQQIAAPMQIAMIGSFFAAIFALGKPDATLARVLAFVPFCSPLVMLTRVLVGHPAPWEVALSVAILIASIAFFVTVAARMYRIGVLLYGARPSLRTVFALNHARVSR